MVVLEGGAVSCERASPVAAPPCQLHMQGRLHAAARDILSTHSRDAMLMCLYRGTSLTRKRNPLGPYRKPMPRVLGGS